jgi:hypothetical protein
MKIFLDTEFIENGKTIEPISIGLVRSDGEEYYAEFVETDLSKANDWVKENVIPSLKSVHSDYAGWDAESDPAILKTNEEICNQIVDFVGEKPEFWGYFADYDWVLICQLFGSMTNLPETWPMLCLDLKQEMHINKITKETIEKFYPQPTSHNSLEDARWLEKAYRYHNELVWTQ